MKAKSIGSRLIGWGLTAAMAVSLIPGASAASGMANFQKQREYPGFSDVPSTQWYAKEVQQAYELGLVNGTGNGTYQPDGDVSIAEAITIAAQLNATYSGERWAPGGTPWYNNAVNRLIQKGIIERGTFSDYTAKATRGDLARIFSCLPEAEFAPLNQDVKAPDIQDGAAYADAAYLLYRAGVITGTDQGEFQPQARATRAQVAAIANRIAKPESRVKAAAAPANSAPAEGSTGASQETPASEAALPTDGNRIVFRGTVGAYSYNEVLSLQKQADPNPGSDMGETYYLIVLDAPQNMSLKSGDPTAGLRGGEVHLINVTYVKGIAQYVGQHLTCSVDPQQTYWPSDTSLPLGEPSTSDLHVLN